MPTRKPKSKSQQPAWSDVKRQLADSDRPALLALLHDLYAAHPDTRDFLHTRLSLGENPLEPYKEIIDRWLWPNVVRDQDISIAKAKQAISSYKKAAGDTNAAAGLAELQTFFCECACGFSNEVGFSDEDFFTALVAVFEQAAASADSLPPEIRDPLFARLTEVCEDSEVFGYGVAEDMEDILANYAAAKPGTEPRT